MNKKRNQYIKIFENIQEDLKKYIITTLEKSLNGNVQSDSFSINDNELNMSFSYTFGDKTLLFEVTFSDNVLEIMFSGGDKYYNIMEDNGIVEIFSNIKNTFTNNVKPRLEQDFT